MVKIKEEEDARLFLLKMIHYIFLILDKLDKIVGLCIYEE